MMQDNDDHFLAMGTIVCPVHTSKHSTNRRRVKYDRKALVDPCVLDRLNNVVQNAPWIHPSVEPTSYVHITQDYLSKWLPIIAPLPKRVNRSSIMADETFHLLCRKHVMRKRAEYCGRQLLKSNKIAKCFIWESKFSV